MAPIGVQRETKAGHGVSFGPMRKNLKNGVPAGSQKPGSAARGRDLWRAGKTSDSEKSIAKHWGKRYAGQMAKTGAVKKGGLLRGKFSQGRPRPLRLSVKERRSDAAIKKT